MFPQKTKIISSFQWYVDKVSTIYETMGFCLCFTKIGTLFYTKTQKLEIEKFQGDCGSKYLPFNVMLKSKFQIKHNSP